MRWVAAVFMTSIICCPSSLRAEGEAAALVAICDQAAASPLDTKRPAGVAGVPADKVDPKIAIPACEAASKAAPNDPRIAFQLGRAYYAAKAYESARAQYEKADAAGYALASNNLAAIYMAGDGVLADAPRAMRLFEKAANAGLGFAMKNLGEEYLSGKHVAKDIAFARRWYEKGAEAGDISSMTRLGVLYQEGKDVKRDYAESRRWYEKAAVVGEPISMAKLGYYYQDGLGGPQNAAEAQRWYKKAIEAGNTDPIVASNLRKLDRPRVTATRRGGRSYSGRETSGSNSYGGYNQPPMRPTNWGTTGQNGMGLRPGPSGSYEGSSYGQCAPHCF